jgi:hypothetical protein
VFHKLAGMGSFMGRRGNICWALRTNSCSSICTEGAGPKPWWSPTFFC